MALTTSDGRLVATGRELADWLGIKAPSLKPHEEAGRLVRLGTGYDLKASVRGYCEAMRETASGRGGEAAVRDLTAERARLAAEQADHHAMRNAVLRGELIRADEAERVWRDHIRQALSRLLAVPSRVRSRLGHIGEMEARVIDREIRDAATALGEVPAEDEEAA